VANEFGYTVDNVAFDAEAWLNEETSAPADRQVPRAPVVTVMGHVDHGKTSLLDAIRHTTVSAHEIGGITQHIGAYEVEVNGRKVTFLDTPGHEAFTAMRARGARLTDIVVLVVAVDEGVRPQTIEAINHARAAQVPFIVALTKMDKADANPERVKKELANYGVVPEEWGGDTMVVPVSAKTGEGLSGLLEMILLQADVLELKTSVNGLAKGTVIEAKLDKGRGPVATVLVQQGTLKVGDPCVCGIHYGKVRALFNSRGQRVAEATPAMPVEVLGLTGVPAAGDAFVVARDELQARQVAEHRQRKQREATLVTSKKFALGDLVQAGGEKRELRLVIKGDVQGSVEALSEALQRLSTEEVKLTVLHASVGGISESDVLLAAASKGIILGFQVRPEVKAAKLAEQEGVEIRLYTLIYEALADVRAALEGLLAPVYQERILGRVEVRQTFTIPRVGVVAGGVVKEGKITRGTRVRLIRDHVVMYAGRVASLRRFKEDVREVAAGYECGLGLEGFQDIKVGDMVEAFELHQVTRHLDSRHHDAEERLSA
jgi:translation initiation factor IF-2